MTKSWRVKYPLHVHSTDVHDNLLYCRLFCQQQTKCNFDHKNVNLDFLSLERPSIINGCAIFFLVFFVVQIKWRDRCISAVTPFFSESVCSLEPQSVKNYAISLDYATNRGPGGVYHWFNTFNISLTYNKTLEGCRSLAQ